MRALTEAETRQRIVEATVELHQTLGPAKTTIKAIAERAGVQRATVYNHFPDLQVLFEACNAYYYRRHPMPDPTSWVSTYHSCAAAGQWKCTKWRSIHHGLHHPHPGHGTGFRPRAW